MHPRGQAELASLFITSISKQERKFIIETHSDYMVKRARIEIRNKRIRPDDVSLVYFEPEGSQVNAHNIEFDEAGNLLNTPIVTNSFSWTNPIDFLASRIESVHHN